MDYSRDAGNSFYCASTNTWTTQAGLSVTKPAWSLYNPPNSGKLLTVIDIGVDLNSSPAAAAGFIVAYSTAVSPSTTTVASNNGIITSELIGRSTTTAQGICLLNSSLPATPNAFRFIGGTTGASAIGGVSLTDLSQGKIVVAPGFVISIQSTSAAAIWSHVLWREDNL